MREPIPKPEKKKKKKQGYIRVNKQPERKPSILPEYKQGYNYEPHEVYGGRKNRLICFEHGLWVWLSPGDKGDHYKAHHDKGFIENLKQECQRRYEETHTRVEFMQLIGRNYL